MFIYRFFESGYRLLALLFLLLTSALTLAADSECASSDGYRFICGPRNAEDMVIVPDTKWVIASSLAPGAAIYLIDSQTKKWTGLYPADQPRVQQDMEVFAACPGAPDPASFVTHGLNMRPGQKGHSTLYVVGHGGREAIEVYDVDANSERPVLTWKGCVMLPEGMSANSVASFNDGSLVTTVPLFSGKTIGDAMAGEATGAIFKWSPGDAVFSLIEGTQLPYANGIEVSADGREIYVVSAGLFTVTVYSNSNPARQLRTTLPMAFVPDNLHMGSDGKLITAGMLADYPPCGSFRDQEVFDLEKIASCPRPFVAKAINPLLTESRDLARGPANGYFSNATMALQVGDEVWIGTFAGDRIAYWPLQQNR